MRTSLDTGATSTRHSSDTVGSLSFHPECPAPCVRRDCFMPFFVRVRLVSAGLLKSPHIGVEGGGGMDKQRSAIAPLGALELVYDWRTKQSSVDLAFLLCFSVRAPCAD
jgi:hypothetical protein